LTQSEREDIRHGIAPARIEHGFRSEVDERRFFRILGRECRQAERRILGDLQDKGKLTEWAASIKEAPEGFTAFKISIDPAMGECAGRYATTLSSEQVRRVGRGYANAREAVGDGIDIAVHCHNELDTTSAIQVARAIEPMAPLFYEDRCTFTIPKAGRRCAVPPAFLFSSARSWSWSVAFGLSSIMPWQTSSTLTWLSQAVSPERERSPTTRCSREGPWPCTTWAAWY
jgi:hypothetical protein